MRSRLSRRALLVVLALGVAQLAAGCGGSSRLSEDAYRTQLAAINREVSNAADAARGAIVPNSSVQQIRSALQAFAVVQQRAGDKVAKLRPPKKAESANALLARGLRDLAAETRPIVQRLASAQSSKQALGIVRGSALQDPNARGIREINRAVTSLRKLGFPTGLG